MLLSLAAALLLAVPADTLPAGGIRGTVQSDPSGLPLTLAIVEVEARGRRLLDATTDSTGLYRIPRVPAGRRLVRVRHLDHAPIELEVLVPAGADVVLDFALTPRPLALPAVAVQVHAPGGGGDTTLATRGDLALVSAHALQAGASGAAAALGNGRPPGEGPEPGDPEDALFVRGAAADLKLVLLDGAPVYAPFHTGGLIQTFDSEALGSARLYLGGAPARYDGGLAYVMDMRTRAGRGDAHHVSGSLDAVSGRVLGEGPLPAGGSYLAVARGLHGATASLVGGESFPFAYSEGLVRLDLPTGASSGLALTAFANAEGVRLDTASGGDPYARWGNAAASLRWRAELGATHVDATAALTSYGARLPWRGARPLEMEAGIDRARVALDLARGVGPVRVRWGGALDRTRVRHHARSLDPDAQSVRLASRDEGSVGSLYVDGAWQPRHDLSLRAGLRGDLFSPQSIGSLSPRISGTWLAGESLALTLAAGRYHQMVRVPRESGPRGNFADSLGLGTELSVSRATHLALTLDQQVGTRVRLGLEGFVKRFEGVFAEQVQRSSQSGVDVWLRHAGGPVSGWLGYSLAWTWEDRAGQAPDRFAGRHLVSAGADGELPGGARLGLRVAYGAGLPYTTIYTPGAPPDPGSLSTGATAARPLASSAEEPPLTAAPDEPYLRLDAELSRTWAARWRGRRVEWTPYVRVLNALDRRDALFYARDPDGGDPSVATLPLLPVAGFSFRF